MSTAVKRSHKKKPVVVAPKRSHKKKVPVEVYSRQQKQAANFGGLYEQPKRSHKKKVPSTSPLVLGDVHSDYPRTATTFWKQMEPGIHAVMGAALVKSEVRLGGDDMRSVTRRIYRAAVLSAASFLKQESPSLPSEKFLREQTNKAVDKAIRKLFNSYPPVY